MVVTSTDEEQASNYDRASELKAFDDTKAGVKGLVDAGIDKIPRIFHLPQDYFDQVVPVYGNTTKFTFPIIDLYGVEKDPIQRSEVVQRVANACATWGFFQVINHGVPESLLEEMRAGARRFFEQDTETRKQFYTRDFTKKVVHYSNFDLFSAPTANWRDTLFCYLSPNPPNPEDLPAACRDVLIEYSKQIKKVGYLLFDLISEALGLKPNHLKDMDCLEGLTVLIHYYPPCPQPELTMGTSQHADSDFLTVLLQDHIGGLQVLHQNQWIHVPPTPGALVVNCGDLLQLISNDKFISSQHRVLANRVGPRVSVASFFGNDHLPTTKLYGPIKELLSEENPPKYRETLIKDYVAYYRSKDKTSALSHFRI